MMPSWTDAMTDPTQVNEVIHFFRVLLVEKYFYILQFLAHDYCIHMFKNTQK